MYSALIHHNKLVPIFRQIRWISKASKTSMLSEYGHSVQFPVSASGYSDRIINERHPAATLLANLGSMIIQRQLDVDTESENRYKITTWQGTLLASIVEKNLGSGNGKAWKAKPAFASFIASVFDDTETELLRIHRPFSCTESRISVYSPIRGQASQTTTGIPGDDIKTQLLKAPHKELSDMNKIGEAQFTFNSSERLQLERLPSLRQNYNLFLSRQILGAPKTDSKSVEPGQKSSLYQFAHIDKPFASLGNRPTNFGLMGGAYDDSAGLNYSTVYALLPSIFEDLGLCLGYVGGYGGPMPFVSEARRSKATNDATSDRSSFDQAAVMLATAVGINFDYSQLRRALINDDGLAPVFFYVDSGSDAAYGAGQSGHGEGRHKQGDKSGHYQDDCTGSGGDGGAPDSFGGGDYSFF